MGRNNKRRKDNESGRSSDLSPSQKTMDSFFTRSEKEMLEGELFVLKDKLDQALVRLAQVEKQNEFLTETIQNCESSGDRWRVKFNDLEQYSRRNNVRFFGVKDSEKHEDIYCSEEKVLKLVNDKLGICMRSTDIDIAHRIGRFNPNSDRAIIVKFVSRKAKMAVLGNRRKLKNTPFRITEDLTTTNYQLLRRVRDVEGVVQSWSKEGRIFAKDGRGTIIEVKHNTPLTLPLFTQTEDTFVVRETAKKNSTEPQQNPTRIPGGPSSLAPVSDTSRPTSGRSTSPRSKRQQPRMDENRHSSDSDAIPRTAPATPHRTQTTQNGDRRKDDPPVNRADQRVDSAGTPSVTERQGTYADAADTVMPRAASTPRTNDHTTVIQDRLVQLSKS